MTNILMTGATGFIGRKLSYQLHNRGYKVYGLVRSDKFSTNIPSYIVPVHGDLVVKNSLVKAVMESKPDIVVHLAALTPVRFSFDNPAQYGMVNYIGTVNLIEAIKGKVRQYVHASTAEVYYPSDGLLVEEDKLWGGTPYGVSKASADFYVQSAMKCWSLPATILRPVNTFGREFELPEEARGYLVEKCIIQMLTSDKAIFDGNPYTRRSWMHVEEHINGYLTVIDNNRAIDSIFNVSPSNCLYVGEIVKIIAELIGFNGEIVWETNPRPYDPPSLCLDGSKLWRLGWRPLKSLHERLAETIEYWRCKLSS